MNPENGHPDTCFCGECGGGGEEEKTQEEYNPLADEICNYIEETINQISLRIREETGEQLLMAFSKPGQRPQNGLSNLKNDDLPADGTKTKWQILWAGTHEELGQDNKYAYAALLKVQKVGSAIKRMWPLSEKNPCLETMINEFPQNEKEWHGREVLLFIHEQDVTEKKFIRVEVLPMESTGNKKKEKEKK